MKILVTAGSTWVKIDEVRIITNRFTGKTGLYLAKELKKRGYSVTLLVNSHCLGEIKGLKVIDYKYFDDFKAKITKALKEKRYDVIIHSAAVSDYQLASNYKGKVSSGKRSLVLKLKPTEKIIKRIRKLARRSLLIQFKLQPKKKGIINKARKSLIENGSNFVVANALEELTRGYKGILIDEKGVVSSIRSKKELFLVLNKVISRF